MFKPPSLSLSQTFILLYVFRTKVFPDVIVMRIFAVENY
jgi:hypothetical protein